MSGRPKRAAAKKPNKMYDEFDSDSDPVDQESEKDSEDDSDFEDPDKIEVPGGGKSLETLKQLSKTAGTQNTSLLNMSRPSTSGFSGPLSIDLTGDVIHISPKVPTGGSLLRPKNLPPTFTNSSIDDEVQVISETRRTPFSISVAPPNNPLSHSLLNRSLSEQSLLSSMYSNTAQGGALSSLANGGMTPGQLDMLKKSIQNGDLARILTGQANPYSMWTGLPGNTGSMTLPGFSSASMLSAASKMGNPYAPVNAKQLTNLWGSEKISSSPMSGMLNLGSMGNLGYSGMFGPPKPEVEDDEVAADDEEDMGVIETYSNYWPMKLTIGKPHPDPVVETASMASVEPPDVWYNVHLPEETIEKGKLSALQIEAVTYACQQHNHFLPNGDRAGFLIGDGAGVGKGRTIAGLIFENWLQGRKKAIWVSVSNDLKYDSERDLKDIGAQEIPVHFLSKMKYGKINSPLNGNVKNGVIYSTYSALIGESNQNGNKYKSRLKQLTGWCGEDFDGCIIFDECHRAKNLFPGSGTGQGGKPTKTGQTVLELQQQLPKARIVYASATGASEPKHMAYMVRLGIWGPGSPFKNFQEFLSAVEKRGVGAMEIVAMDMKLRGIYIARQLSFQGVSFKIDEVELSPSMRKTYDESVKFWVDLMHKFEESAELINADKKQKKTMWGQFWSSHQRFFKYLCIASKVPHVVKTASEVIKMGKCVVIGLQSTGEARTMEALEREEELTDFVSTAKGVLQSLIEKHFPAPDRNRINQMLARQGLLDIKPKSEDLGKLAPNGSHSSKETVGKRKAKHQAAQNLKKKLKRGKESDDSASSEEDHGSDFEMSNGEDDEEEEEDSEEFANSEEEDFNPFGSGSDSEEDDPWARKRAGKKKPPKPKGKPKTKEVKREPYAELINSYVQNSKNEHKKEVKKEPSEMMMMPPPPPINSYAPSKASIDRACQMKDEMLKRLDKLASSLPANTLDQLIDELGGPDNVSEMTGRKGRVVSDDKGEVRYESRSEQDIPLETLNLTEKDRFMRGEKDVAIISEAASSGISLQADRRVANQKRRVHMTLELPWSADRAIQQFGRTHRSNQVSAPEYILLISDLAGEHRFASIVAKRLESLGALTHGDRRATGERDLSRFNIDNKYGRAALEATFRAIMGYEAPVVKPPSDYPGDFFKDIADGLVGVGLITQSEDLPGILALDKGYNDMSKFLNRILGLPVNLQNLLFKYFSDTLAAIITTAKRAGRYDQGILDVGLTEEDSVDLVRTHTFVKKHATGSAKIELHVLQVERGLSWTKAKEKWSELVKPDEGFYISHQIRNGKQTAILAVLLDKTKKETDKNKKPNKMFVVYRPNTGQQLKHESLAELKKKYKKVGADEAEPHWAAQFDVSMSTCSHAYWRGNCKNVTTGVGCEIGVRRKTYNVLAGSVLSVWAQLEAVLTYDGNKKGTSTRMQVVRLKLANDKRIVGTLIPNSAVNATIKCLEHDSEKAEEIHY